VIAPGSALERDRATRPDRWPSQRGPGGLPLARGARCSAPGARRADQLGFDPNRQLVAAEAAILDQDRSLDATTTIAAVNEDCPYKGVAADRESFCGREQQVAAALDRLHSSPVRG
jgi:hypothetical protein